MKRLTALSAILFFSVSAWSMPDFGPVDMGAFYTSLPIVHAEAKLGQLIKVEKITTFVQGAQAWKIAYVSSDVLKKPWSQVWLLHQLIPRSIVPSWCGPMVPQVLPKPVAHHKS
jgi:hypothetical protein